MGVVAGEATSLGTALVAALGALLGVVVTVAGTAYAANRKIAEIEVAYAQRLRDTYLANARAYLASVYLPLHLTLTTLVDAYRRSLTDQPDESNDAASINGLRTGIEDFLATVDTLLARAAGAFLTTTLEETLESFTAFLKRSLHVAGVERRAVVSMSMFGSYIEVARVLSSKTGEGRVPGSAMSRLPGIGLHMSSNRLGMHISIPGLRASLRVEEVLAAPLRSREFEERFVADTTTLRALIKEITLGAHAGPR